MDRHVRWLRRRIIASVATQTAEVFAVVAVAAFALMYWRTSEGPVTSLFGAVVVAQIVAGARVGHAMRNNPLNYVFMRKYVDRPFSYRVSRFQGEEEAHAVAERLPGFAPVATIRDADADPEPIFDVYHDPSRLVAASVSRASGSVALVSSLADGRIMVTYARSIPPHERLVMNLTAEDTLDSGIETHRRAISARSDVVELASSAHQVVLDSLSVEYDSYLALGPTLSPFLDLESNRRSWMRLSARIKPEELAALPVRLGPDMPLQAARSVTPKSPTTVASPVAAPPVTAPPVTAPQIDGAVPQVVAPQIVAPQVVAPLVGAAQIDMPVPQVVAPNMTTPNMTTPEMTAPAVVLPDVPVPHPVAQPPAAPIDPSLVATAPGDADPAGEDLVESQVAAEIEPEVVAVSVENLAPALSAVVEADVVALVIPDPRKAPVVIEDPVVAPVEQARADAPVVGGDPVVAPVEQPSAESVVVADPASPARAVKPAVVAPTEFVTLEPDPIGIDNDPAPITEQVPAVVIRDAAQPATPVDLVAALPAIPSIELTPAEPAPTQEAESVSPVAPIAAARVEAVPVAAASVEAVPVAAASVEVEAVPVDAAMVEAVPVEAAPVVVPESFAQVVAAAPEAPAAFAPSAPPSPLDEPVAPAAPIAASLPDYALLAPQAVHPDAADTNPALQMPHLETGPVGPPASLAEAVQSAPDTAAALIDNVIQEAPPADWHRADSTEPAPSIEADLPDLANALGYSDAPQSSRPRLSAVLRANNASATGAAPQKRSRRKSR